MRIRIERLVSESILPEPCCRGIISRVLRDEGFSGYDLTLVLADSRLLRRLNRRFRGMDRPTDVISFALLEGTPFPAPCRELGDIYISVPRARLQARQYRVTPKEELARLMIHGVLHLLGYDHIKPAQGRRMRQRESHYLRLCSSHYGTGHGR